MSERNLLMPGVCGPAERIFTPPTEAARAACFSCIQFERCHDQRDRVAQELRIHGTVGETVIAGEIVDLSPLEQQDPLDPYRPSELRWNIEQLPPDPDQALIVIRQENAIYLNRVRKRRVEESLVKTLAVGFDKSWVDSLTSSMGQDMYNDALTNISRLLINYGSQKGTRDKEAIRYDMTTMQDVARRFIEQVAAIKDLGISLPIKVASHHSSDFYKAIIDRYKDHFHIRASRVKLFCTTFPRNPVDQIELEIVRTAAVKAAQPHERMGKSVTERGERNIPEEIGYLMCQLPNGAVLLKKRIQGFYRTASPELAFERSKDLIKGIIASRADHADLSYGRRADLFIRHRNEGELPDLCRRYKAALHTLSPFEQKEGFRGDVLQSFAVQFLEGAVDKAEEYELRYQRLATLCYQQGIVLTKNVMVDTALRGKEPFDPKEVQRAQLVARLRARPGLRKKGVQLWMINLAAKVEGVNPTEAMQTLASLLEAGQVKVAIADKDDNGDNSYVVDASGRYLVLMPAFDDLLSNQQLPLLRSGLHRLLDMRGGQVKEPRPEAKEDPVAEAYSEVMKTVQSRPLSESELVPEPQPQLESVPEPEPEPVLEPEPEPEPTPVQTPVPELKSTPKIEPEFIEISRSDEPIDLDKLLNDLEYNSITTDEQVPQTIEKPLLPYEVIAKLSDGEQAAIYIAHCMPWLFTFNQRKAGWADEQRVLELYRVKTRSELIDVVQTKIMPLVRSKIVIPQYLSSEAILRILSDLNSL